MNQNRHGQHGQQLRWVVVSVLFLVLGAGCSGINTTQSVSPATFLLPGFFGEATPGKPDAFSQPLSETAHPIAQSR